MFSKIFTALPDFLSKAAREVLFESQISEQSGLVSWPRVMQYIIYDEFQVAIKLPNPPQNEVRYTIQVHNLEAYEYLTKAGWVYDPKHTGRPIKPVIDNRPAPGQGG